MKTEDEIRRHARDLGRAIDAECSCAAAGHAQECESGRMLMAAAMRALLWALGEEDTYQDMVDHIAAGVRRRAAGLN